VEERESSKREYSSVERSTTENRASRRMRIWLALTSPISDGRSVDIVRLRTTVTEFSF
jgi:hypothetical protein